MGEIRTVGELKSLINNLDDDLAIECSVHKMEYTYIIKDAYVCGNVLGEVILQFDIKMDLELTERDYDY